MGFLPAPTPESPSSNLRRVSRVAGSGEESSRLALGFGEGASGCDSGGGPEEPSSVVVSTVSNPRSSGGSNGLGGGMTH